MPSRKDDPDARLTIGYSIYRLPRSGLVQHTVAIKLLPPDLTRDETAKQRFLQEAQAASALDHPNICTIFEINETDEGQLYLVMAYYEGETLKERIARGPLKLDDAVDIATQVGQGTRRSARRWHRASGYQAGQPARHQDGRGQDPGLWVGQAGGDGGRDADRHDGGHGGLHVTRAGEGPRGRSPHGHLVTGGGALRDAGGTPALSR